MSFDSSLFHFLLFCFIFGVHSDISLPGKLLVENADFGLLVVGASNPLSLSVCHSFIHKAHPFSKGNSSYALEAGICLQQTQLTAEPKW
ncbi:hypothetical protein AB3S75_047916 [Citrus x aurantiifolia]